MTKIRLTDTSNSIPLFRYSEYGQQWIQEINSNLKTKLEEIDLLLMDKDKITEIRLSINQM